MRTPNTCSITRSLPFVVAAMTIACSANDDPRVPAAGSNGAVHENRGDDRGSEAGDSSTDGTFDDGTRGIVDNGDDDASADDPASRGASTSADSDGDGLPDSVETNSHVFRNKDDTGTDPRNWDTDGDGISDRDEVLKTAGGLDLFGMGTNPLHRDILIEYDWFADDNECAYHSHRPTPSALAMVSATFAQSPLRNPDGTSGINIIHDYGQGGLFDGGNAIADADGIVDDGVSGNEFANYRAKNFAAKRQRYFHYALLPHRYTYYDKDGVLRNDSSGQALIRGDALIVSPDCWYYDDHDVASTIVHELGHNLNLLRGGNTDTNDKPNYNSVMNYKYQFAGIDTNCTPEGDGVIDYSRKMRLSLDERALDEHSGICAGVAWDWNGNGVIESQVSLDINGDEVRGILEDHDDWPAIVLDWHGRSGSLERRDESAPEVATCDSRPAGH
ncbi:MAG TPA: hypothetical protein VFK05_04025 [Polyangiaceae bacterium]|nr:hypothetical protein [Polyangiaceae bacterium]